MVLLANQFPLAASHWKRLIRTRQKANLSIRGPNVCLGYAMTRDDLARGDDFAGVLRTGDVARLDDDGFIYITGRLKRFVKIHGVSVNLEHVENVIRDGGFDCHLSGRENGNFPSFPSMITVSRFCILRRKDLPSIRPYGDPWW